MIDIATAEPSVSAAGANAAQQPIADALYLPLGLLTPSPTNPRKRFVQSSIEDLASTIEPHGVMQPLLVRPNPKARAGDGQPPYELVAGERRWRACRWLDAQGRTYPGEGRVPVLVRALSDAEVLVLQLVENIQRDDLHPLEEAEHYRLMHNDAVRPWTVEELAAKVGRSPNYIYGRLSLCRLVPAAREAFLAEKLDVSKGLKVAAMPPEQQAEIVEHITTWGGEPMGARAAATFIRDRYMLLLASAPFNTHDADLVPAAGACTMCPKRTAVSPQLFGDVSDGDRCMDSPCFATKRQAARDWAVATARAEGYAVLSGDAAARVLIAKGTAIATGWHPLKDRVPPSLAAGATVAAMTVEEIIDKAGVAAEEITAVDHPQRDELLLVVPTTVLSQALRRLDMLQGAPAPQAAPPASESPKTKRAAPAKTPLAPTPRPSPQALDAALQRITVMPKSAKTVKQPAVDMFVDLARRRTLATMMAHKVCGELWHRGRELDLLLPDQVAQMVLARLVNDTEVDMAQVAAIAGCHAEHIPPSNVGPASVMEWAMGLDREEASSAIYALLALDDDSQRFASKENAPVARLGRLVGVAWEPVEVAAHKWVDERLQLELLERARPAPKAGIKPRAGAPVRYRNKHTGETWSGRGLKPKWLQVALERGQTLADFEPASAEPPAQKVTTARTARGREKTKAALTAGAKGTA